jgi:hypothetical protein
LATNLGIIFSFRRKKGTLRKYFPDIPEHVGSTGRIRKRTAGINL